MSTTTLFVELLIVGFQAIVWIIFLVATVIGPQCFQQLAIGFSIAGTPITMAFIAVGYFLGVILDEFYESLIDPWAKRLRKKCNEKGLPEMWDIQAFIFTKSNTATMRLEYIRSRIRIVRSSVFNLTFIIVFSILYYCIRLTPEIPWRTGAIIFTSVAGLVIVPITIFVYRRLVIFYWGRAKSIYKSLHEKEPKKKRVKSV